MIRNLSELWEDEGGSVAAESAVLAVLGLIGLVIAVEPLRAPFVYWLETFAIDVSYAVQGSLGGF